MPIFEYRCLSCRNEFELLILANSPTPACPSCGATSLERTLSLFAVNSAETMQKSWTSKGAERKKQTSEASKERNFYEHDDHHH